MLLISLSCGIGEVGLQGGENRERKLNRKEGGPTFRRARHGEKDRGEIQRRFSEETRHCRAVASGGGLLLGETGKTETALLRGF
ncbi:hypothetical protein QQF64_004727 [Cirrhinus molitorella]|uniref:Uncharacterized protein n=1 Tax=Cirrhinus molitorella TaxID=172907 RepID=A0ABR3MK09_9TELE